MKILVAQVDEISEGIVCPHGSGRGLGQGAVLRPGTGRTTTGGASGVFTLCGINLQKLAIKIWKINVPASFGSIIHVFLVGEVQIFKGFQFTFLPKGFVLVGGHIEAELGRRVP